MALEFVKLLSRQEELSYYKLRNFQVTNLVIVSIFIFFEIYILIRISELISFEFTNRPPVESIIIQVPIGKIRGIMAIIIEPPTLHHISGNDVHIIRRSPRFDRSMEDGSEKEVDRSNFMGNSC